MKKGNAKRVPRSKMNPGIPGQARALDMKVIIRLSSREELKALPILMRHSPGTVLPGRTYILSEDAVAALRANGVRFTEVSRESGAPGLNGVVDGERI